MPTSLKTANTSHAALIPTVPGGYIEPTICSIPHFVHEFVEVLGCFNQFEEVNVILGDNLSHSMALVLVGDQEVEVFHEDAVTLFWGFRVVVLLLGALARTLKLLKIVFESFHLFVIEVINFEAIIELAFRVNLVLIELEVCELGLGLQEANFKNSCVMHRNGSTCLYEFTTIHISRNELDERLLGVFSRNVAYLDKLV